MNVAEHGRTALRAVLRHRLRSALSALGVMFGVGSLVAMLAVAEGARAELVAQIERLGTNTVMLRARPSSTEGGGRATAVGGPDSLTLRDVEMLEAELPGIRLAAPLVEISEVPVDAPKERPPSVVGTTWEYFAIKGLVARTGRPLAESDEARRSLVCVLGAEIARDLGALGRVGATLSCGPVGLEVVGVLEMRSLPSTGQRVISSRDFDRTVFVPLSASSAIDPRVSSDHPQEVSLAFDDALRAEGAAEPVRRALGRGRAQRPDYELVIPSELLEQASRTQRIFGAVLGAVAVLSLAVGGVGIMNIMLVSVAERTREIGLRRAVGASAGDILVQFLVECLVLTMVGAFAGLAFGVIGAGTISRLAGWSTLVTDTSVLGALAMALAVGTLSGLYPALKAARLAPMTALRST